MGLEGRVANRLTSEVIPAQASWPRVGISILNWNGWRDTLECLESVQQPTYPNYQVIVVDNGSWDDSVEMIRAWARENLGEGHVLVEYLRAKALEGGEAASEDALERAPAQARLVLIRNEDNLGFTGGNNVAIHYALHKKYPADYVFLLNNDATVEKDCLTHLVNVARQADAGIVGAIVMDRASREVRFARSGPFYQIFFLPLTLGNLAPPQTNDAYWGSPVVSGAAMLIRKDLLEALRSSRQFYLNASLFCYVEELELCLLARKSGQKSVVARGAVVYHGAKGRSDTRFKGGLFHYYFTRNRILVANSVLSLHWKVLFHLLNLLLSIRRVLKLTILRKSWAARAILCGLADGYRGVSGKWKHHDREARRYGTADKEW